MKKNAVILFFILISLCNSSYLTQTVDKYFYISIMEYVIMLICFTTVFSAGFIFCIKFLLKCNINKKIIKRDICISIIFVSLLVLSNNHIFQVYDSSTNSIEIIALGEKNENSNNSEVWLKDVTVDGSTVKLKSLKHTEDWEFRDGALLSYLNQPAYLNLNVSATKDIKLTFLQHSWSGEVIVKYGSKEERIDLYSDTAKTYSYDVDMKEFPNVNFFSSGSLLSTSLAIILLSSIIGILLLLAEIKSLFFGVLFAIVNLILFRSILNLDKLSLIIVCVLSVLVGRKFFDLIKSGGNKWIIDRRWHGLVLFLITMIVSFMLAGNRLFFQVDFLTVSLTSLLMVICISIVVFLYIFVILDYLMTIQTEKYKKYEITRPILFWLQLFIAIVLIWTIYLVAYFPANMSADSMDQWHQALGIYNISNWHPAFHTLVIKFIIQFYENPVMIAVAQIIFGAAVISSFLLFLCKNGLNNRLAIVFAVLFAALPNNGVNIVTLWKDIPYTISLLWLTLVLYQFTINNKKYSSILSYVNLTAALCSVALFRHNGIVVVVIAAIVLISISLKNKNYKRIITIIVSVIIVLLVEGPVYSQLQVIANPSGIKYVAPVHGIASVVANGGEVSSKTELFLSKVMPLEEWKTRYSPYSANEYMFNNSYDFVGKLSNYETSEILAMYIDTWLKNPSTVIYDRFTGINLIWDFTQAPNAYNYRFGNGLIENDLGITQTNNILTKGVNRMLELTTHIVVLDSVLWRGALYTFLLLLVIYFILINRMWSKYIILIPIVSNLISLLLSMSWQDYRYVYFEFFLIGFILIAVTQSNSKQLSITNARDNEVNR